VRARQVIVLAATALAAACTEGNATGPAELKLDRDTCAGCGMVISEKQFAAQVRGPAGASMKFDDLGCALGWLDAQPFKDDPATAIWVVSPDGAWVDARAAHFTAGHTTPMAFGFAPSTAAGALDFETTRARLRAHHAKETP